MTQILLGQSYYLRFDPKLWEAMQPYPPLGTLYAASWLRQHGYNVALFDAMLAESEDEWASALDEHKPRYAIIYEDNFNYLSKMCLLRILRVGVPRTFAECTYSISRIRNTWQSRADVSSSSAAPTQPIIPQNILNEAQTTASSAKGRRRCLSC
jgi:hypothetical protein